MEKIISYTNDGSWRNLEFTFHKIDEIKYQPEQDWVTIKASGRVLTFSGTSFYTQPGQLDYIPATPDMGTTWREYVNKAYAQGEKILMIFTKENAPLIAFHGTTLSLTKEQNLSKFNIDGQNVYLYNLNYFVLSKT